MRKENKLYNGKPIVIPSYIEDICRQKDLKRLERENKRKESMAIGKVSAVPKSKKVTKATKQPILAHEVHQNDGVKLVPCFLKILILFL